jgi:hypothetical protein
LGFLSALGGVAIQNSPLDAMATLRSILDLLLVGLLLTPAMRKHTRSERPHSPTDTLLPGD